MKALQLKTADGILLSAKIFEPEIPNRKLVVINSATGVKQQLYFSFANYLREHGYTVLTYDYRGIGESKPEQMRGFQASMRLWGTEDFKAVTNYIHVNYPNYNKFCIGHSVGALILGMNPDATLFESFIFIATQDAYVGNLRPTTAAMGILGFGLAVPLTTSVFGYFPAQWFGIGESLPKGVAFDWRTLILHKKSTGRLFEKIRNDYSKKLRQKTVIFYAEDDPWVTMKGMESLMNKVYPNLKKNYRELKVSESDKGEIGHINFFRSYNRNLWHVILDQL